MELLERWNEGEQRPKILDITNVAASIISVHFEREREGGNMGGISGFY